jgi:hypothetical protein
VILLWYSLASSCYFKDVKNPYLNPPKRFSDADAYASDFRVKASWKLETLAPFLPMEIEFGLLPRFDTNLVTSTGRPNRDFTNCVFTVQKQTNFAGLMLPQIINVQYFSRLNDSSIIRGGTVQVTVTNVHDRVKIDSFVPEFMGNALLSDLRTITPKTPFAIPTGLTKSWPSADASKAAAQRKGSAKRPDPGFIRFDESGDRSPF